MALATQANQRRAKYGVNVAVALLAAFALVLLVNWLAVWTFARLPDGARPWLRYDLTATRAYTLSEQTRRVLAGVGAGAIEGEEALALIGVYAEGTPQGRAVDELLAEYAAIGQGVAVRRFDPEADAEALRGFYAELAEGLGVVGQTAAMREAIERAGVALRDLNERFDGVLAVLNEATVRLQGGGVAEQQIAKLLDGVGGGVLQSIDTNERVLAEVEAGRREPLPPWSAMQGLLGQRLPEAGGAARNLGRWLRVDAQRRDMPAVVRDAALRAERALVGIDEALTAAQARLASAAVDPAYRRVREAASARASVLVRRGDRVRAVSLDDMFVADEAAMDALGAEELTAAQTLPVRFLGEERLTGAVVSVSLKHSPLLVFVSLDGVPALGQGGSHNQVAARARASGFEVASWPVVLDGSGVSLTPAPLIEAERRVVWFVPGADASRPTDAAARAHTASVLRERVALGDGVLLTPRLRPNASVVVEDPLLAWADGLGIGVDPGAVVLAPGVDERGRAAATNTFRVQRFLEHPVTQPLNGRSVWFDLAHPVTPLGLAQPLVALQAEGLWVESAPPMDRALKTAEADEFELADGAVAIAAAVEVAGEADAAGRLAVVADGLWSIDTAIRTRQAEGNVELFGNLVYWLAGLDDAIAATPRSQGVRRIGPMTQGGRGIAAWLVVAGWPMAALLVGLGVWAVRRRG